MQSKIKRKNAMVSKLHLSAQGKTIVFLHDYHTYKYQDVSLHIRRVSIRNKNSFVKEFRFTGNSEGFIIWSPEQV